jgi:hypothetical protein
MMVLDDHLECFAMDRAIRDIYYGKRYVGGKRIDVGLCRSCRDKLMADPVWKLKMWLLARLKIESILSEKKGKDRTQWKQALKMIDKIERELEKTPEVKAMHWEQKKEQMCNTIIGDSYSLILCD